MKTAKCIHALLPGFRGSASLYELDPPLEGSKYVVVSAVLVLFTGPETYIFKSDERGNVEDWTELPGSFRGDTNHQEALRNAGYQII